MTKTVWKKRKIKNKKKEIVETEEKKIEKKRLLRLQSLGLMSNY